jgi:hypothetical protein
MGAERINSLNRLRQQVRMVALVNEELRVHLASRQQPSPRAG